MSHFVAPSPANNSLGFFGFSRITTARVWIGIILLVGSLVPQKSSHLGVASAAVLALGILLAPHIGAQAPPVIFVDVTERAGISFRHHNGAAGDKCYPELFGGGVAVLDIDGDRWPDLLFVDGKDWRSGGRPARHGLYRNNHDGTFKDVAAGSGLDRADVYGLGASVADYDNDGRDDVFMTTVDGGRLFHNEGSGRFADVTARAGIRNTDFTVSAAWLDYDRDGLADLFIGNYVRWSPDAEARCAIRACGATAVRTPISPSHRSSIGISAADGSTTSRARRTRSTRPTRRMGVAVLDYNSDGWPDVFVGSDRVPAKLYRNDGQRPVRRRRRRVGRGAQRERRRARQHGRGRGRLRPIGPPASGRRQLSQRDARPLPQRERVDVRRRRAAIGSRPREPCSPSRGPCSSSTTTSTDSSTSSPPTAAPTSRRRRMRGPR